MDSHAHLSREYFESNELDSLLSELSSRLKKLLLVGINKKSSREAIQLAEKADNFYAAAGIHPHEAEKLTSEQLSWLEKVLAKKKVIALGEIGLDYYYENSDRSLQLKMLEQLLGLARNLNCPVIFHIRPRKQDQMPIFDDLFTIMDRCGGKELKGVFHCFCGNKKRLQQCLDYGFYISFAGNITFRNAEQLRRVAREVPLDRLLLETDTPYLSPCPRRGKKNSPLNIQFIYNKMAEIKNVSLEELDDRITENWQKIFENS
ncbi:MAG: TatD family hydrolase [bacterium]